MGTRRTTALAALLGLGLAAPAGGQDLVFSPDTTAELGSGPSALVDDDDVGIDDGAGGVSVSIPPLPPQVDVIAMFDAGGGDFWLSFDITVALPGLAPGTAAEPRDVVAWDRSTGLFSLVFDGSTAGVPANARVDAMGIDPAGFVMLSFDITVALPGPLTAADEDLVSYVGPGYTMFFDGSALGVDPATDLDAADVDHPAQLLLVSFDTSGSVAGVSYDDEDVVAYDYVNGLFKLYQDSSVSTDPSDWPAADLVALPEPAGSVGALAAAAMLAGLARRRRIRTGRG